MSKGKVILVNPSGFGLIGDKTLPAALLSISTYIHNEYDVKILDLRHMSNWKSRLKIELTDNLLCVGITSMTGSQIASGIEVAKFLKNEKDIPIIWGGIHATSLPEQTAECPWVDYVVKGEGEFVLPKLLGRLVKKERDVSGIHGVYYKDNGSIRGSDCNGLLDLEKLSMIPYHLVDIEKYIWQWDYGRGISIFSSRGCPFQCVFCINTGYNQSRWRAISARMILEEVKFLVNKYYINHIQFLDDNFFVSKERVLEAANLFLEAPLKFTPLDSKYLTGFTWSVLGGHVNNLIKYSQEELSLLYRSGLRSVGIGVESVSKRILDAMKKNLKIEDLITLNKRLRDVRISPFYSYISGFPGETDDDLKKSLEMMLRLKEDNPDSIIGNIKPLMCYPNTALYDDALRMGLHPPQNLQDWSSYDVSNYESIKYPWLSKKRKIFLTHLYYLTILLNPKYIFIKSKIFRLVARISFPITLYRAKHFNFRFLLLARLFRYIHKLILKSK